MRERYRMNEQDLRVIKTENNIKSVFVDMLKKNPVEKITVTALAKQARINKGTFYLHYQDIYALYNEVRDEFLQMMTESMDYCPLLLTDPGEFCARFTKTINRNARGVEFLWPKHDLYLFQPNLNDRIIEHIYDTCPIERSSRNDMVLDIIVASLFRLSTAYMDNEPELTTDVLMRLISTFYPESERQK